MPEYIVRETGYPGQIKQETVGELVRCKDCWKRNDEDFCPMLSYNCYRPELPDDFFCAGGEREFPDELPDGFFEAAERRRRERWNMKISWMRKAHEDLREEESK